MAACGEKMNQRRIRLEDRLSGKILAIIQGGRKVAERSRWTWRYYTKWWDDTRQSVRIKCRQGWHWCLTVGLCTKISTKEGGRRKDPQKHMQLGLTYLLLIQLNPKHLKLCQCLKLLFPISLSLSLQAQQHNLLPPGTWRHPARVMVPAPSLPTNYSETSMTVCHSWPFMIYFLHWWSGRRRSIAWIYIPNQAYNCLFSSKW